MSWNCAELYGIARVLESERQGREKRGGADSIPKIFERGRFLEMKRPFLISEHLRTHRMNRGVQATLEMPESLENTRCLA